MSLLSRPTVSQHVPNPGIARSLISRVQTGMGSLTVSLHLPSLPSLHPLIVEVSTLPSCAGVPAVDPDPQGLYYHLPSSPVVGQTS